MHFARIIAVLSYFQHVAFNLSLSFMKVPRVVAVIYRFFVNFFDSLVEVIGRFPRPSMQARYLLWSSLLPVVLVFAFLVFIRRDRHRTYALILIWIWIGGFCLTMTIASPCIGMPWMSLLFSPWAALGILLECVHLDHVPPFIANRWRFDDFESFIGTVDHFINGDRQRQLIIWSCTGGFYGIWMLLFFGNALSLPLAVNLVMGLLMLILSAVYGYRIVTQHREHDEIRTFLRSGFQYYAARLVFLFMEFYLPEAIAMPIEIIRYIVLHSDCHLPHVPADGYTHWWAAFAEQEYCYCGNASCGCVCGNTETCEWDWATDPPGFTVSSSRYSEQLIVPLIIGGIQFVYFLYAFAKGFAKWLLVIPERYFDVKVAGDSKEEA
jgi:hypothetical protein